MTLARARAPMWAPWRMEYILGSRQGACIFCEMSTLASSSFRDNLVLLVQPHGVVCLNRYPFAASHLLVATRRHVSDLSELADDEHDSLMRLVRDAAARLRRVTRPEGLNIGFNLGKAAGAGIADHTHGHIVPRWNGDTNFMPVLADVRVMPEYLDDSWKRLSPAFADLPGEHPTGD